MEKKRKIIQISVFPIIFVTDSFKKPEKFKCGIFQMAVLNQFEDMH